MQVSFEFFVNRECSESRALETGSRLFVFIHDENKAEAYFPSKEWSLSGSLNTEQEEEEQEEEEEEK